MPRKIQELRILNAIVNLAKEPTATQNVFFIADTMVGLLSKEELKARGEIIKRYPHFMELYESRYSPPSYDVGSLSKYPAGTLAHAYGIFMSAHKFSPDWYPEREVTDPLAYMRNRINKTHDIVHTLTGYGGDPAGEIGVQSFYLGQMPDQPMSCAIIASGFLRALGATTAQRARLMHVICEGYEMGKRAQPVLFRKWEEDWGKGIEELRRAVGINPARGASDHEIQ